MQEGCPREERDCQRPAASFPHVGLKDDLAELYGAPSGNQTQAKEADKAAASQPVPLRFGGKDPALPLSPECHVAEGSW